MSAGSGVASPDDGDILADDAEDDAPPVLPASPVARIASGAVSLPGAGGEVSVAFFRGIFPRADHWLASSCFMLVETYVSIVERLLQPVYNRLPDGQRPTRPFQHTLRDTGTLAARSNDSPIPTTYILVSVALADLLKRISALRPGVPAAKKARKVSRAKGSAKAGPKTKRSKKDANEALGEEEDEDGDGDEVAALGGEVAGLHIDSDCAAFSAVITLLQAHVSTTGLAGGGGGGSSGGGTFVVPPWSTKLRSARKAALALAFTYALVPPSHTTEEDAALAPIAYLTKMNPLGLAKLKKLAGITSWSVPYSRNVRRGVHEWVVEHVLRPKEIRLQT